jgi:hypothetical protein
MTKIVIPPPQQSVIEDKPFTEPWRRHMDVSNQHLNAASQLISVVAVTAGSSAHTLFLPDGWRKYNLSMHGLVPGSSGAGVILRASTFDDGTSLTAGYSFVRQTIDDSTATNVLSALATSQWSLASGPLSTASSGGYSGEVTIMTIAPPTANIMWRSVALTGDTTPLLIANYGSGKLQITDNPLTAVTVRVNVAQFSTGTIALYGDR